MAGVYIRGMEMPESCGECRFLNPGNYKGKEYPYVCDVGDFLVKPSETDLRDGLCPLVEVPDHGGLVDKYKLVMALGLLDATKDNRNSFASLMRYEIADILDDAEIVIPADKEEI